LCFSHGTSKWRHPGADTYGDWEDTKVS